MSERLQLVVYELSDQMTKGYTHQRPSVPFPNVDWFTASVDALDGLADFIRGKNYFDASKRYLVVSREGTFSKIVTAEE